MKKSNHNFFIIIIIFNLLYSKIWCDDTIVYNKKYVRFKTSVHHIFRLGEIRSIIETNYFIKNDNTKNYNIGLLYSYFLDYPFEYGGNSVMVNRWGFSLGPVFSIENTVISRFGNIFECTDIDMCCYYSFIRYYGAEGGWFFNHNLTIDPGGSFVVLTGDNEARSYWNSIFDFNRHSFTQLITFSLVINIKKMFLSPYIGIGLRYVCIDFIKFKFHSHPMYYPHDLLNKNTSHIRSIFPLINFGIYLGFKKDIYE